MDIQISNYSERVRVNLRTYNIRFAFQRFNLLDLTVLETLELPLKHAGMNKIDRIKKVIEVLKKLQIIHWRKHFLQELLDKQQSVAIITTPKLTLE